MKRTIVILAVAAASVVAFAQPPPGSTASAPPAAVPVTPAPATTPVANPTPASLTPAPAPAAPLSVPMVKKESAQIQPSGVATPLTYLTKPVASHKVENVDGMSSRPWAQIVGIRPGYSAFPPPELHQSTMYLFWIGRDPH